MYAKFYVFYIYAKKVKIEDKYLYGDYFLLKM